MQQQFKDYFIYPFLLFYIGSLLFFIGLDAPLWSDEIHFYETIRYFYNEFNIKTLVDYNEMSTPLPFMLYAIWAKIFNIDIVTLRIFSIIISVYFYYSYYQFIKKYASSNYAILYLLTISLNPYMIGLSIFIYTDMLCIVFLFLSLKSYLNKKYMITGIYAALAIWSRQYAVYFIIALCIDYLITNYKNPPKLLIKNLIYLGLATTTIIPLFVYWGGIAPNNELKNSYLNQSLKYDLTSLITYVTMSALYFSPIIGVYLYKLANWGFRKINLFIIGGFIYTIIPIKTSNVSIAAGHLYVGLLDKIMHMILPEVLIHTIYMTFFSVGVIFIDELIHRTIKKKQEALTLIIIFSFLFIQPFSYMIWEKYLICLLPFVFFKFDSLKRITIST